MLQIKQQRTTQAAQLDNYGKWQKSLCCTCVGYVPTRTRQNCGNGELVWDNCKQCNNYQSIDHLITAAGPTANNTQCKCISWYKTINPVQFWQDNQLTALWHHRHRLVVAYKSRQRLSLHFTAPQLADVWCLFQRTPVLCMSAKCTWRVAADRRTKAGWRPCSVHRLIIARPQTVRGRWWQINAVCIHRTLSAHMIAFCNTSHNFTVADIIHQVPKPLIYRQRVNYFIKLDKQ